MGEWPSGFKGIWIETQWDKKFATEKTKPNFGRYTRKNENVLAHMHASVLHMTAAYF